MMRLPFIKPAEKTIGRSRSIEVMVMLQQRGFVRVAVAMTIAAPTAEGIAFLT